MICKICLKNETNNTSGICWKCVQGRLISKNTNMEIQFNDPYLDELEQCDWCLGSGDINFANTVDYKSCPHCGGTGRKQYHWELVENK